MNEAKLKRMKKELRELVDRTKQERPCPECGRRLSFSGLNIFNADPAKHCKPCVQRAERMGMEVVLMPMPTPEECAAKASQDESQ